MFNTHLHSNYTESNYEECSGHRRKQINQLLEFMREKVRKHSEFAVMLCAGILLIYKKREKNKPEIAEFLEIANPKELRLKFEKQKLKKC